MREEENKEEDIETSTKAESCDKEEVEKEEVKEEVNEEEKEEVCDKKDEQIKELKDRVQRQMAEFDNFRKRTAKEKTQMFDMGAMNIIEKILPVVDNFERAIESIPEEELKNPFIEGINQIYKQLNSSLEEMGVSSIEAVGCEFNPDIHEAVMHGEDEEYGENEISDEFQKGYKYKDSVVRHSKVRVMN